MENQRDCRLAAAGNAVKRDSSAGSCGYFDMKSNKTHKHRGAATSLYELAKEYRYIWDFGDFV